MAALTVDTTKREIARLLGVTYNNFELDLKLSENLADVLNQANDEVCRELEVPVRNTTLLGHTGAISFAEIGTGVREDGVIQVKLVSNGKSTILRVLSPEEADMDFPNYEKYTGMPPKFLLLDIGNRSAGLIPYPSDTSEDYRIRWTKIPDTLTTSGTAQVMDGELTSWHKLVPLYAAIMILERDYFGGEAGNGQAFGGNAQKQQHLRKEYQLMLNQALKDRLPEGVRIKSPLKFRRR